MENMRNMLHGVVVYVLFFTVQSYEERIFTSETPISDGKNDSNARTGISKEPKYGTRTASIMRNSQTISGDIIMKENTSMTIPLRCASSCNPPCKIAWYINGQLDPRDNPVINIKLDRKVSGVYQCEASGEEGKVEADPVNVTIQYPPGNVKITPGNDTFYTKRGMKPLFDIICEADCLPECTYTWYTEEFSSYETGNNLFARKSLKNRGSYRFQCRASNDIRPYSYIDSRWITVEVKDGPDNVTIKPSSSSEKENSFFQLTCHASCIYVCQSYSWNYNHKPMTQSTHILNFQSLSKEDSGKYQCRVTDDFGTTNSEYYTVNVQYPPGNVTITPGNDTFYIKRYGKPDIICEADCVPECTYGWYRERYPHFYTTGNNLFATRSLGDNGSYKFRCLASNTIGRYSYIYSRRITVEVKDGPDNVTIIPLSSEIENSLFQLVCSASCHNGCQSYSWYYNGRWRDQEPQILKFQSLSKEDSGNYRCRVTDDFGTTYSEYYTVNVQYGPKNVTIQYSSSYEHLIEGHNNITITCDADCNPECLHLFYRNGKLLNKRFINERVHRNMSGRYTCSARNSVLNTHTFSSNFVDINIKYKPTITSFVNQKIITAPSLLDFAFSVDSFPSSNVTIFHETKRLTFIPNVTGQLSFNVSVKSCLDQGEYRIEAVNDAGSDRFIFIADVKCSPIVVRYSNVSHKKFRVGDLLHLTVAFMANPTAEVLWSFVPWNKNTSLEVQTHQIQNHKESTKIEFILSDTNKFGKYILELKNELGKTSKEFDIQGPTMEATKTDLLTTISSQESDSNGDISMSPTSWKGKASALRETEMNTFLLQQDKLQEEVQKLRLEGDVLRLKRNYYVIKLQLLMKEHPGVINEVFGDN